LGLLLPFYSIGSDTRSIEESLSFEFSYTFKPVILCKPQQSLPVIFSNDHEKIEHARWGIKSTRDDSGIFPWVRMEGIIKNIHTRTLIRKNRCLIPANGFFIRKGRSKYFIYFPKEKIITFGAIWKIYRAKESEKQLPAFSIISCPSQGKISQLSNRMPLVINPYHRRKFLKDESPLMDITRILKKDNILDFNGFSVDPALFSKKNISRKDFRPEGKRLYMTRPFPEKAILGSYYYSQS
jgi:putative SOS response-associated peptidase YedK